MNFQFHKQKGKGRFGAFDYPINYGIDEGNKIPAQLDSMSTAGRTVETPTFLGYTKYGRMPHLTADVAASLPKQKGPVFQRMRLCELMEQSVYKSLQSSGKQYKDFTSSPVAKENNDHYLPRCSMLNALHQDLLYQVSNVRFDVANMDPQKAFAVNSQMPKYNENTIFFCSVQDTTKFSMTDISKYAEEKSVSVWTQSGRRKVTPEAYMDVLSMSGAQLAEALCDITPVGGSGKRCKKSVDRTLRHLDRCISILEENPYKYQVLLFGAIVGGVNMKERKRSAVETAKRNVHGFVLEGFDQIEENFNEILQETLECLPQEKPKILLGTFNPDQMVDAVILGIDIIDNSYVYDITQQSYAAVFEYRTKRLKTGVANIENTVTSVISKKEPIYEIDLKEKCFKDDFRPIADGCNCFTCLKYTRAYLNHLLVTNEMLAQVLLMMHNIHHLTNFMNELRCATNIETLQLIKEQLQRKMVC